LRVPHALAKTSNVTGEALGNSNARRVVFAELIRLPLERRSVLTFNISWLVAKLRWAASEATFV